MSRRTRRITRPAGTLVEFAIVCPVFFVLVLGMLEVGLGVFRYHQLAEAARRGARQAIVHGSRASSGDPWGPEDLGPILASDAHPLAEAVRPGLAGFDHSKVTIEARWPDDGNAPGLRVRIDLTAEHSLLLPSLVGLDSPLNFQSSSTMRITH